ncbi:carboxypeptidase-like regulatory domain-containing protein [Candidatus Nitrososphaera sp. FF02]|uniref:carboxypeptidase-like regulatory domain-containing protein n=1 Tax=Candidatus Nitrososphaera sp. FF02 TaxID=3398226 RepID=UPI0039ED0D15
MELKIVYAIIISAALLTSSFVYSASAAVNVSGQVKNSSGSGISSARVSAEASGFHYHSTVANGSGQWSLSVDNGISYTIDTSKDGMNRDRETGIVGPASGISHTINTQTPITVKFKITSDEEFRALYGVSWRTVAKDRLFAVEPYFRGEHNIRFTDQVYYDFWDSADGTNMSSKYNEVRNELNWPAVTNGAKVLWTVTGESLSGDVCGVATDAGGQNQYPSSIVKNIASPPSTSQKCIMHEISHNYGLDDLFGNQWYDVMNKDTASNLNWMPSHDDLMQQRRGWN